MTPVTAKNSYVTAGGKWYYVDKSSYPLKGEQVIDYVNVYFRDDYSQVKGDFAPNGHYYDKDSGALVTNRYVEKDGKWYYVNDKGDKLIGAQTIDGVEVYFDKDGVQAKGIFANADHFMTKTQVLLSETKSSKSMANAIMLVKMVEKFTQEHILFMVKK